MSSLAANKSPRVWLSQVMSSVASGAVGEAVAVAGGGDDVGVVAEPVDHRRLPVTASVSRPSRPKSICNS